MSMQSSRTWCLLSASAARSTSRSRAVALSPSGSCTISEWCSQNIGGQSGYLWRLWSWSFDACAWCCIWRRHVGSYELRSFLWAKTSTLRTFWHLCSFSIVIEGAAYGRGWRCRASHRWSRSERWGAWGSQTWLTHNGWWCRRPTSPWSSK